MSHIMVVEDEAHLAQGLRFNLEAEGHTVVAHEKGETALSELLQPNTIEVVVLDGMLPGMDGFAVVGNLRRAGNFVPVLMLTALHRPEDVLKGFESGADDYLSKPFDLKILLARINSLLRRRAWAGETAVTAKPQDTAPVEFDDKVIDFGALELRTPHETIGLTLMEADLLRYLIEHQGQPVSRQQILKDVWNLPADMDTRAIDNFIVRLRRYIEPEPAKPRYLITVRGLGYKLVMDPAGKTPGA